MEISDLEAAIEGILFASGEPVAAERLALALALDLDTVNAITTRLADYYSFQRRGIRLLKLDGSFQLCSSSEYSEPIQKALETRKPAKLSQPALEVLSIIAYYQPVTRAYIDQIRGVDSAYTVGLLLDRKLIEECGKLAVPGRPILYRTTVDFLRTFGLSSLDALPELPNTKGAEHGQLKLLEELAPVSEEQL